MFGDRQKRNKVLAICKRRLKKKTTQLIKEKNLFQEKVGVDEVPEKVGVHEALEKVGVDEAASPIRQFEMNDVPPIAFESPNPVFAGAKINSMESDLAILATALRHNFTAAAIDDVCRLVNLHTPEDVKSDVAQSYTGTNGLRNTYTDPSKYKIHFFCSNCHSELPYSAAACPEQCIVGPLGVSYFVEYLLENILQEKFSSPEFPEQIKHKLNRMKRNADAIEDVYDGRIYKSISELSEYGSLGVGLNTDGVPIFKKSKFSIWPIFMIYYDLPPAIRYKYSSMSLVGLWLSAEKPRMNTFLEPICRDITSSLAGLLYVISEKFLK
eukprot:Pompholyxophrys_punicea_v1_NODE_419_length_2008_cov_10.730671.p1 type:complete len:325 gc:universal NODE_419_length_2008_cov_10.730671:926-1900(+)